MIKNYKEYISESNNKISNIDKLKQLYRKNGFTNEDIKQISDYIHVNLKYVNFN